MASEANSFFPIPLGDSTFHHEAITDISTFVTQARAIFREDADLADEFAKILKAQIETKRSNDTQLTFTLKPATSFAAGALAQVLTDFHYGFTINGDYRYQQFYREMPPISLEDYQKLHSVSHLTPVVNQDRRVLGIRIPKKAEQLDDRVVYGTNPSEDVVMVETTATIPYEVAEIDGSLKQRYLWITRYAAYKNTHDGLISLGNSLIIATPQYSDVDYVLSDLDLNAITSLEQLREFITIPTNMIIPSDRA